MSINVYVHRLIHLVMKRANNLLQLAMIGFDKGLYDESCFLSLCSARLVLRVLGLIYQGRIINSNSIRHLLSVIAKESNGGLREVITRFVKEHRKELKMFEVTDKELILSLITKSRGDADLCINIAQDILNIAQNIISAYDRSSDLQQSIH